MCTYTNKTIKEKAGKGEQEILDDGYLGWEGDDCMVRWKGIVRVLAFYLGDGLVGTYVTKNRI